jgi:acetyl esterase/lipase
VSKTVDDVKALQKWLHREEQWDLNPQQWALIGHSMGSMVALNMGQYLHAQDLVVAVAPKHSVLGNVNALKRWGYALAYQMAGKTNGDSPGPTLKYEVSYNDVINDKAAMQAAKAQGFLQTRIPIRNYPLFRALDGEALAQKVGDPTALVVVGEKDRVVQKWSSRRVYDALTTAKTWMEVPQSGHSVFQDAIGPKAIKDIVAWIDYRLGTFNEVRPGSTKRLD